jgi:hypothetical protein
MERRFSLGFCALLNPFAWEHILISLVPEVHLELLEAPVPCITGLNWPKTNIGRLDELTFTQETVVVLLDREEVMRYNKKSFKTLPKLADMKGSIAKDYNLFEKTEDMKKAVQTITNKIELSINKAILNYLPLIFPLAKNKEIDMQKIKERLLEQIKPIDENFAKLFCDTQMFTSCIEQLKKINST